VFNSRLVRLDERWWLRRGHTRTAWGGRGPPGVPASLELCGADCIVVFIPVNKKLLYFFVCFGKV